MYVVLRYEAQNMMHFHATPVLYEKSVSAQKRCTYFPLNTIKPAILSMNKMSDLPFSRDAFHGASHERVLVQHRVEVLHRQRKQIAISLGSHAGHASRVGQQADLAEVRAITERRRDLAVGHHDVDDALLDEEHLVADGSFFDDDIT
jgi:hypothetical protein